MLNLSSLLCDGSNGLVCILFSDVLVCSITNYFHSRVVPEQLVKILSYTAHLKRLISYSSSNCLFNISRPLVSRLNYVGNEVIWKPTLYLTTMLKPLDGVKAFCHILMSLAWRICFTSVNQILNNYTLVFVVLCKSLKESCFSLLSHVDSCMPSKREFNLPVFKMDRRSR